MKTITSQIAQNKKVLLRIDLDVPLDDNNNVEDVTRLTSVLPTLNLLKDSASQIIIIGHLGRPEGQFNEKFSLKPVCKKLSELLSQSIEFIPYTLDSTPLNSSSHFVMLDNMRFNPGEETNDSNLAKQLASLADIFVFDAFAVSHRAAASTVGVTDLMPSYAGLRVTEEVKQLSEILENPSHPLLVIVGGAKIETKLPVITNLQTKADSIFVGGKLPHEIKEKSITFPPNVQVATMNASGKDIDENAKEIVKGLISNAKMIVWNGPVGLFEDPLNQDGTLVIAENLALSNAKKIIGGGETIQASTKFGIIDNIDFVSVGGGAMLEFLSGKQLPGLKNI
jgi:phosphoglycerate kinase